MVSQGDVRTAEEVAATAADITPEKSAPLIFKLHRDASAAGDPTPLAQRLGRMFVTKGVSVAVENLATAGEKSPFESADGDPR